jgi:hypothetical protein
MKPAALSDAIHVVRTTPGYNNTGDDLLQLDWAGRIRVDMELEDRAQATLRGIILLGPEAVEASPLSLAQTLVHEHFHLRRQHPLHKTLSFWRGVFSGTPPMRRYEEPAYQAAIDFLEAVKQTHSHLIPEANAEQAAVQQVFQTGFGGKLRKPALTPVKP